MEKGQSQITWLLIITWERSVARAVLDLTWAARLGHWKGRVHLVKIYMHVFTKGRSKIFTWEGHPRRSDGMNIRRLSRVWGKFIEIRNHSMAATPEQSVKEMRVP